MVDLEDIKSELVTLNMNLTQVTTGLAAITNELHKIKQIINDK